MNDLSYIQDVLYSLKHQYGEPIDIYRFTSQDVNTASGKITKTKIKFSVSLAVLLSEKDSRKFSYSRAFIAENRAFTFGGYYDMGVRVCMVDGQDLPVNFAPLIDDYVVAKNVRYQVSKIDNLEGNFGFLLSLKETKGLQPQQLLTESVESDLGLKQGTANG